jgi:hypothetical protein
MGGVNVFRADSKYWGPTLLRKLILGDNQWYNSVLLVVLVEQGIHNQLNTIKAHSNGCNG